jgi:hypothetical protein
LEDVAHLVHPDKDDESHREPYREEQRVRSGANHHRQGGPQELGLEREQRQTLELGE